MYTVNASTAALTLQKAVDTTLPANANFTAIAYNPNISKYIYADYGGFDSVAAATLNKLYVIDPTGSLQRRQNDQPEYFDQHCSRYGA